MEPTSIILNLAKVVIGPLVKGAKWVWDRTQLKVFQWRDRKQLVDKDASLKLAQSALGGSITLAIPFRNFRAKSSFILAVQKYSDEDYDSRIHVLEKAGDSYIRIWTSDSLFHLDSATVEVADINNDGYKEIAYQLESFGSGGGSKSLYIYSLVNKQLFNVTEYYDYSDASGPGAVPVIEAGDDEDLRNAVIKYAHTRGLLQGNEIVDFENPKFAILRWHKENGEKRIGQVKTHLYQGEPVIEASITCQLETDDIIWTAYFKGPLYGFIKPQNKHFIAYSPQWVYEWVKGISDDGQLLWFVCHCIPGLFSFDWENRTLNRYCGYSGETLPEFSDAWHEDGCLNLSVGDTGIIQIWDQRKLAECRPFCRLATPHLPDSCNSERYPDTHKLFEQFRKAK